jgi:uncharacterized protein (DUF488 family)
LAKAAMRLHTVGHSTHRIEIFFGLLEQHQIESLVDVRSYPSSKRWPQFNQDPLRESCERAAIEYRWVKELGGRRRSAADSINDGWEHPAFRAYADHIAGAIGQAALVELIAIATAKRSAIMCSEGLWWQCHRRIISDYMALRGWEVVHIMPDGKPAPHRITPFALVSGEIVVYRTADAERD